MPVESKDHRSWTMSRVKGKDTTPEIAVRRLLRELGYGYRLHAKDLPGKPDIVFRGRRKAIFVHGCFWHRHPDPTCKLARLPKSNVDFWETKLTDNFERDKRTEAALRNEGWKTLNVWECQIKDTEVLSQTLAEFLSDDKA
ncbi:very short patch repair endonuclease [Neorhizobium galegae]|uniref:Very short patch repair endonuclease n=1 Tax=Neorhizobium galegae bv. officinalis TaxID=323656 RepID=A0A0T7GIJ1_NEOGA|nr:very short patch repair endonuclease [Neorhizobium galegae]CDZ46988.1 DNA mismatch endonuclease Vsr [Neorhizobium galegae bv. officinalis]